MVVLHNPVGFVLSGIQTLSIAIALGSAAYCVGWTIYNLYFHPLKNFPGPIHRRGSWLGFYYYQILGTEHTNIKALHDKYGEVVRIAPNILSFINPQTWKDVYGFVHGKQQLRKPTEVYGGEDPPDMLIANDADHTRMRKLLSHAFSEQALKEQEPLLNIYFNLLVDRLKDVASNAGGVTDIAKDFNHTTFDVIGDLSFGESFHCLETGKNHPWVENMFDSIRVIAFTRIALQFKSLAQISDLLISKFFPALVAAKGTHEEFTKSRVLNRLSLTKDRKDFISFMRRHEDERGMSEAELIGTMATVIRAGSETTATLLSGVMYHLCTMPHLMKKIQREVRGAFESPDEITFASTLNLKYTQMVLDETLRVYPPVPTMLPRITQPQGDIVCGQYIPGNVYVGVHQWSAYHSAVNFTDPDTFDPERYAVPTPEKYKNDNFAVRQPFSSGPRVCIGRSLAIAEMRSILARLIYHFDFELSPESKNWWQTQRVFLLWGKDPLMVRVSNKKVS